MLNVYQRFSDEVEKYRLSVRVDHNIATLAKAKAALEGKTIESVVDKLLTLWVNRLADPDDISPETIITQVLQFRDKSRLVIKVESGSEDIAHQLYYTHFYELLEQLAAGNM